MRQAVVITISDSVHAGRREDLSGATATRLLEDLGFAVGPARVVPDERDAIADAIRTGARDAALVVTTGGTGLGPRDVTPEATRAALDREAPGIAERLRAVTGATFPRAALSRGIAGVRGRTLVVNLPGSTSGVRDMLAAFEPIARHAVDIVRGDVTSHDAEQAGRAGVAP